MNFPTITFRYQPEFGTYQSLNSVAQLQDKDKHLISRLALLQEFKENSREMNANPDDTAIDDENICIICCNEPIGTILYPCKHKILCKTCAFKCESCPFCRTVIDVREYTTTN